MSKVPAGKLFRAVVSITKWRLSVGMQDLCSKEGDEGIPFRISFLFRQGRQFSRWLLRFLPFLMMVRIPARPIYFSKDKKVLNYSSVL